MKKTLVEVRAELEGNTVAMLRTIVRKDSTIKGVSRMRKAELVEAAVKVVSKLNPEVVEEKHEESALQTKVKAAGTVEELEAVLLTMTKAEMLQVFGDLTNGRYKASRYMPKGMLAHQIAYLIEECRVQEQFRALTLDEKYEYLTSQTDQSEVHKVMPVLTDAEFVEIARRLGIDVKDCFVTSQTMKKLRDITRANQSSQYIVTEYNGMVDSLMEKSESELRAEIRELCDADDIAGYTFEYSENWSKAELVRELTDWYLFNSPEVDDGLTSVYYEKAEVLPEGSPAEVPDAVSEAIKVIKSDAPYTAKHEALAKCTDPEMFEVMKACTGGTSVLGAEYRSHEDLAGKVLNRILQTQRELRDPKQKVKSHKELTEMTLPALRKYVRTLIVNGVAYAHNFRKYTTARWSKDDIVNELDSVRIRQESSEAYYRHEDEESAYWCKYRTARVRFEEGATYEIAGEKYTVVKRLSTWLKVIKEGAERSLPAIRVDVKDGVEELEVESGVILRAESEPEGSSIEVGSVFAVCPRSELPGAKNGYVTCTVTARTATTASIEVISASGSSMYTGEVSIQKKLDGTEYIEFMEFKSYGPLEWTARDSLIAA